MDVVQTQAVDILANILIELDLQIRQDSKCDDGAAGAHDRDQRLNPGWRDLPIVPSCSSNESEVSFRIRES
jgi:hypothetical protein